MKRAIAFTLVGSLFRDKEIIKTKVKLNYFPYFPHNQTYRNKSLSNQLTTVSLLHIGAIGRRIGR